MELGLWILIGGLVVGIVISAVTAACIFSKKRTKSTPTPEVAKMKTPSPKKDGMPSNLR